jgi:hypothetical protein
MSFSVQFDYLIHHRGTENTEFVVFFIQSGDGDWIKELIRLWRKNAFRLPLSPGKRKKFHLRALCVVNNTFELIDQPLYSFFQNRYVEVD